MERKVFSGQNLIWVMLLLVQLRGYKCCIEKERKALLELKKYMISKTADWGLDSVLPTWTNDTKSNCCRWEGLKCNQTSGRIIELSIGQTNFKESSLLNLSLLHPFEELRSLNLSGEIYNEFNGLFDDVEGYESLRRLRNLEILDLSSNSFNNSIFPFLNAATSLTTLFIQSNYIGGPLPIKELKNLTKLELLDLSRSGYNGSIPEFTHLEKLKALDLSANDFSSLVELQELKVLTNLEVLGLAWNHLDGPIPKEVFCEMKNLRQLDLRGNYFEGQLPVCLGNLNKLRVLDLSSNQLSGNLPASFNSLESLEYLSLSDNNFEGFFSLNPLANLTKLKVFRLSSTSEMLQVETESNWLPKFQLTVAALPFCSLGKIPNFLVYQTNLRLVDLSSNRLSGDIPTWLLENNPELKVLQLKNNSFTIFQIPTIVHKLQVLDFSANDITGVLPDNIGHVLPRLLHMNGSHNGFQGNLPSSMGEMNDISFLDLSYNNFSGELPRSLLTGCFSLITLQLSHNSFSGPILPIQTRLTSLIVLRMHNNLFTGEIGVGLRTLVNLSIFDASNNRLTGLISSSIPPDSSHLIMLLLSNNLLEGTLPPSLLAIHHLNFLDLSGNLLSGDLPSSVVNSMYGIKIFLHNNSFTGPLPVTLLENAYILDLRNNKLSGSIPQFVNTGKMITLLLRGNNLTGSIPRKLCDLTSIRLLDLSDNKLNGVIPPCLNHLSTELGEGIGLSGFSQEISFGDSLQMEFYRSTFLVDEFMLYYDSTYMIVEIEFAAKQRYDSFSGGTLDYMYGLDLSSNELSGVIPAELGDLSKLRALNLSRNLLSSSIPANFSKLKDIESLDLSYNMLQGNIPHQLTNLTSLAVFNVSFNNLSGIIPQGGQFNTFNDNSYLGNPLLCGTPTDRSCEGKKNTKEADNGGEEEEEDDDDEAAIDMVVLYWTTGSTYAIALIGILVLMCFDCPWRRTWLCIVDAFIASGKSMFS
ncbi:receptor like protein 14 [Arabidopsis thaliana]|uniref:Receptor-like protein 14 n=2 Tax=Arabidopsis thaliana TaxID=3702 RepID=RLP14_ARATH|nr:receptor like protein 14 [Arabidopsis thaliana]F4HTV4.1 RecName: Full=Receptor-like protein 14; Short=AtRLP14; Flags: Precursor [Arabidopsis thaliana]AEE35563.1 receptor like protein 14 [Arabidopsis thaliana]|eukprot:NP_177558.4 receptor like protein 14 [Arabidopsis thaliana]